MKIIKISMFLLIFPAFAHGCEKPGEKPAFPDINTAVAAQMIKAHADVKAYVKAMQDYLGCSKLSAADKERRLAELKKYADDFNKLISDFKSKNKS
jgi:hypothetical protein